MANPSQKALARITFYSPDTCPFGSQSATGVRLRPGRHCAVDPRRIPYGATVTVPGIGTLRAVDTGTDVRNRKAARLSGRNSRQRSALVVDVFVADARTLERMAKSTPRFVEITWSK